MPTWVWIVVGLTTAVTVAAVLLLCSACRALAGIDEPADQWEGSPAPLSGSFADDFDAWEDEFTGSRRRLRSELRP